MYGVQLLMRSKSIKICVTSFMDDLLPNIDPTRNDAPKTPMNSPTDLRKILKFHKPFFETNVPKKLDHFN